MAIQRTTAAAPASSSSATRHGGDSTATAKATDRELEKRRQLQHFLVMKAFNLRKGTTQTLAQQFQCLRQLEPTTGRSVLPLGALCEYLSIPPFRRLVLCQIFGLAADAPSTTPIDVDAFVRFLQTAAVEAAHEERALRRESSLAAGALPVPPPSKTKTNRHPNQDEQSLVCFAPSLLSMRFARPPPAPGLWKKREITIQERITEYTKIDEYGRAQHLVEKEKHQSEVIHMESLAGEFAHREITHFEQLEKLNDEVVHHETGREEFVHLKSQHDEVSKFESSIPTAQGGGAGRPEECEQPPPSPTIKRDPSAMDGRDDDGGRASAFPSRRGSDVPLQTPEEDDEYEQHPQYQFQFQGQPPYGDDEGAELETVVDDGYPMEPPFPEVCS